MATMANGRVCDVQLGGVGSTHASNAHFHDGQSHTHSHSHDGAEAHGHSHPKMDNPGFFHERDLPDYSKRNWKERSFSIGLGGPVGSGKTATLLALCQRFTAMGISATAVTNDIFTREDAEFLIRNAALEPTSRIRAVETGGCPHAAIREDISANLTAMEELQAEFNPQLQFVESGGDNLAASYSMELVDFEIYVIDCSGGTKIPRKGGPGISQSTLLVINKTDIAQHVGADLQVMEQDARKMRSGGPHVMASIKNGQGVDEIIQHILEAWKLSGAKDAWKVQ
ncbi:unnamed protein product [Jaminaea pallidilutea]